MLTGDKLETAENIGRSCNLVQPEFRVMQCSETKIDELEEALNKHLLTYQECEKSHKKKAMLIEGDSLSNILYIVICYLSYPMNSTCVE